MVFGLAWGVEVNGETVTGSRLEAAVDGLMSCRGSGLRRSEAVWRVEAISRGRSEDIFVKGKICLRCWGGCIGSTDEPVINNYLLIQN